jgi:hypothetical protein
LQGCKPAVCLYALQKRRKQPGRYTTFFSPNLPSLRAVRGAGNFREFLRFYKKFTENCRMNVSVIKLV